MLSMMAIHCVALHIAEDESEYVIWDGQMKITMNASVFASCVANATDRASLVIFRAYKTDAEAVWPEDMQADDAQPLLELQAGGKLGAASSSSHADCGPIDADVSSDDDDSMEQGTDVADDTLQDEDDSIVHVGDEILGIMRAKVQDVLQQNSGSWKPQTTACIAAPCALSGRSTDARDSCTIFAPTTAALTALLQWHQAAQGGRRSVRRGQADIQYVR